MLRRKLNTSRLAYILEGTLFSVPNKLNIDKRRESRRVNQEMTIQIQILLNTRHRTKTNKTKKQTTQQIKMMSNMNPTQKPGVNPGAREGSEVQVSSNTFRAWCLNRFRHIFSFIEQLTVSAAFSFQIIRFLF